MSLPGGEGGELRASSGNSGLCAYPYRQLPRVHLLPGDQPEASGDRGQPQPAGGSKAGEGAGFRIEGLVLEGSDLL